MWVVIKINLGIVPYVYLKIKQNVPNSTYNRTSTYNRNLSVYILALEEVAFESKVARK